MAKHSEETRRKISESKKGQVPWMKGKKHSDETRRKLSETHKGKKLSEEHRRKISEGNEGHQVSEETRKKISEANKNRPEESNRKISQSRLKQVLPTRDSQPEKIMQKALWLHGIKFHKHIALIGQPDIFIEPNLVVFVDGDHYHANPKLYSFNQIIWKPHKNKPAITAKDVWEKDERVNQKLLAKGYRVIRFWESEINKGVNACVRKILEIIEKR